MPICKNYNFKLWHILLPSKELIYKICLIRDKSKLFLSTLLRILFYLFLFDYFYSKEKIKPKGKWNWKKIGFYILLSILIISICSAVLVIIKKPQINEEKIEEEANKIIDEIDNDLNTKLVERSLGRTEAEKILMPEILEVPDKIKSIS